MIHTVISIVSGNKVNTGCAKFWQEEFYMIERDLVEGVEIETTLDRIVRKGVSELVTCELRWKG